MHELDHDLDRVLAKDNLYDRTLLDPPRWPGCPPICVQANLPAFDSDQSAKDWLSRPRQSNPQYMGESLVKLWRCQYCSHWHFTTKPRDPSGDSSGTGRSSKRRK